MKKAIIIGAGTYGQTFLYYLTEAGYDIIGFFDDNEKLQESHVQGIPVLGKVNELFEPDWRNRIQQVFCPLGDNILRVKVLRKAAAFGYELPNFIHHSALISNTETGKGVYILPGVKIMPYVKLKDFSIVSLGSNIAHHTILEEGSFISTGVNVGANIHLLEGSFVGIGATLTTGVSCIGKHAVIGSGTVVIRNVEDYQVVAGVPGRVLRTREIQETE